MASMNRSRNVGLYSTTCGAPRCSVCFRPSKRAISRPSSWWKRSASLGATISIKWLSSASLSVNDFAS